jgi:hypothetical protein
MEINRFSHGGLAMVRVCVSLLFPLLLLQGCATNQAQTPAGSTAEISAPPAKENLSDCARKNSVVDAFACAAKD